MKLCDSLKARSGLTARQKGKKKTLVARRGWAARIVAVFDPCYVPGIHGDMAGMRSAEWRSAVSAHSLIGLGLPVF